MQSFSPSFTVMFPSWGRGAESSAPPPQDAFQEIFASRLQAALNSRQVATGGTVNQPSRPASPRPTGNGVGVGARHTGQARANVGEPCQGWPLREGKPQGQGQQSNTNLKSQTSATAEGTGQGQAAKASSQTRDSSVKPDNLPQGLRDFLAFLESLPGGALKIPPEQVPAVSAFLTSAGLPQDQVNQLLTPSASGDVSLTAADFMAAWQQAQGQGQSLAGSTGPAPSQPAAATAAASQPQAAPTRSQNAQDVRQTPDYRALWERLTLPDILLPTLRLALANLGGTPEALAQLDREAQGQGIPLSRVWGILQNLKTGQSGNNPGSQAGVGVSAASAQAAAINLRPVTAAEMQEWRQMLLQAGLPAEVVDKLAVQAAPVTEEQLKNNLLSLAPPEEGPPVMDNPKPLYLPGNLRLRPFFWQAQAGSEQPQEQAQLDKGGSEAKGESPAQQFALATAGSPGQTMAMPGFAAEIQGLTQAMPQPGSAPGEASPVWRPFSPEIQEPLWAQLQSGVLSNLSQGESQVTISLNPPDLGQIQLSLQLSGQDLTVTAVATRPEVAATASQGMPQLAEALSQQGLVLTQFQVHVQTQPGGQVAPVVAAARQKGGEPEGNVSTSTRRRAGEVNRFV